VEVLIGLFGAGMSKALVVRRENFAKTVVLRLWSITRFPAVMAKLRVWKRESAFIGNI
jgi:hypothetical protein